jgi:hypothetical protein
MKSGPSFKVRKCAFNGCRKEFTPKVISQRYCSCSCQIVALRPAPALVKKARVIVLKSGLEVIDNIVWRAATSNTKTGGEHSKRSMGYTQVYLRKQVRAGAQ